MSLGKRHRGFLKPWYSFYGNIDPLALLDTNLVDPNRFCTDAISLDILNRPDLYEIESITMQDDKRGSWITNYRFFERPAGKDYRLNPYMLYIVTRINQNR